MEPSVNSSSRSSTSLEAGLSKQYVTFQVGKSVFGIEVERVQEIIRYQPMTPVPLAPSIVKGLVNLRGQIITAIDMRSLLKLEPLATDVLPMNVVVRAGAEVVSFLVDSIGDVIDVNHSTFESTPATVVPHIAQIMRGIFKVERQLILVLNTSACIDSF